MHYLILPYHNLLTRRPYSYYGLSWLSVSSKSYLEFLCVAKGTHLREELNSRLITV